MRRFIPSLHQALMARPSLPTLAVFCLIALGFHLWATNVLNASYARSGFPVPYHVAQLSFSPEAIKGWYATLVADGNLQRYITTQHIDSLFILSTLMLHVGALALAARAFPVGSRGRGWMVAAALLSAIAPLADQAENLVSYRMLADPAGFAPAWAYLYSSLAALKFAMFVFAYAALILGLVAAGLQVAMRQRGRFGLRCTPH